MSDSILKDRELMLSPPVSLIATMYIAGAVAIWGLMQLLGTTNVVLMSSIGAAGILLAERDIAARGAKLRPLDTASKYIGVVAAILIAIIINVISESTLVKSLLLSLHGS